MWQPPPPHPQCAIWGNMNRKNAANPPWCRYLGSFVFHVNHCLKTTSSVGRKGLWDVSDELSIGLETCRHDKSMNKIVLIELVTLSPLTGDWPARLRVCALNPPNVFIWSTQEMPCWAWEKQSSQCSEMTESALGRCEPHSWGSSCSTFSLAQPCVEPRAAHRPEQLPLNSASANQGLISDSFSAF